MKLKVVGLLLFFVALFLLVVSANVEADHGVFIEYLSDEWTGGTETFVYDDANQYLLRQTGSTIYAYTVDKVSKSITFRDSVSGTNIRRIDFDGTYFHVFSQLNISAYTFDGSSIVYTGGITLADVHTGCCDSSYVYMIEEDVQDVVKVYEFDGSAYSLLANLNTAHPIASIGEMDTDDSGYFFVSTHQWGLDVYSFDGVATITHHQNTGGGATGGNVRCTGGYIFHKDTAARIYTRSGSTLTLLTSISGNYPEEWYVDASSQYIFQAEGGGGGGKDVMAYVIENGVASCKLTCGNPAESLSVIGFGDNLSDGKTGLIVDGTGRLFEAYGYNYSGLDIYCSGSMPSTWYNNLDKVKNLHVALETAISGATIHLWDGTYEPRVYPLCDHVSHNYISTNNITIIGNGSSSIINNPSSNIYLSADYAHLKNLGLGSIIRLTGTHNYLENVVFLPTTATLLWIESSAVYSRVVNCSVEGTYNFFSFITSYSDNGSFINCTSFSDKANYAIMITEGDYNNISGWTIQNASTAVRFGGHHNMVYGCNLSGNGLGIYIPEFYVSYSNLIYNNYLNNTNNVDDDGGNSTWNISKTLGTNIVGGMYLGGNYWSNYIGNDTDGDGLGDENLPYDNSGDILDGGDYHPLVIPAFAGTVTADFTYSPSSPMVNEEVTFRDQSSTIDIIISWLWNFGDGHTGTGKNIDHTFDKEGRYGVLLTVRTLGGLSDNVTKYVRVTNVSYDDPRIFPPIDPFYPFDPYTIPDMYRLLRADDTSLYSDSSITIVFIDTGYTPRTYGGVDLSKIIGYGSFDSNGHGTWISYALGYIVQKQIPNAKLISYNVFGEDGVCSMEDLLGAFDYIEKLNPDIVSFSGGAYGSPNDAISRRVDRLRNNGILVVVAAGNLGPSPSTILSPACSEGAIAIGAFDPMKTILERSDDVVTPWSSRGPVSPFFIKPDCTSPGESIVGPWLAGERVMSGTSMATPLIAGGYAVIYAHNKGLLDIVEFLYFWDRDTVENILESGVADTIYKKAPVDSYGLGIPDFKEADHAVFISALLHILLMVVIIVIIVVIIIYVVYKWKFSEEE